MIQRKTDKRKAQGAETKRKLYEIAEKLFAERDFAAVSVEDITEEAGITKGAFYVHFESKDALIALLIADYTSRADTDYKAFLETLPADTHASGILLALTEKIADVIAGTIGHENMKKVYQMMLAGSVGTEAVRSYGRELYLLFQGILERGIQRREIKSTLPVDMIARHFVMAIRGASYEWCIRYPDFDLKEQAMEHIRLLIAGLGQI
jgi:AcrR family transcriptional regulator